MTKRERLEILQDEWLGCTACELCDSRRHLVFGSGDPDADVMIIGQAPGEQENQKGLPFVGPSGDLLNKLLRKAGQRLESVYRTNVVMCYPPEDRAPTPVETDTCRPRLAEQVRIIDPMIIIAAGKAAAKALLRRTISIQERQGQLHNCQFDGEVAPYVVPTMLTLHPAFLLRDPDRNKGGKLRRTVDIYREVFAIVIKAKKLWGIET